MRAVLSLLLIASAGRALPAQLLDSAQTALRPPAMVNASPDATMPVPTTQGPPRTYASRKSMIVGGLIGGALGAFGGAMVGKAIENCDVPGRKPCGLAGMVVGGLVGESFGVPIGVNYAANGRNTLQRSIPVSLGLMVGGLALSAGGYYAFIPGTPLLQIYSSMSIERSGRIGLFGR
jgi:hypothetical protein